MICYIGIGSNLGDRMENIRRAVDLCKKCPGAGVRRFSRIYETESWPVAGAQPDYLNLVMEMDWSLDARQLIVVLAQIENSLGRARERRWASRTIDLDILCCGDLVVNENDLKIPHPGMRERFFILRPLADLAPGWRDPIGQKTVTEMLGCLRAPGRWRMIDEEIV